MSKKKKKKKDDVVKVHMCVEDDEVYDAIHTVHVLTEKVKELQKAARKLNAQLSSINVDIQPFLGDLVTSHQDCP